MLLFLMSNAFTAQGQTWDIQLSLQIKLWWSLSIFTLQSQTIVCSCEICQLAQVFFCQSKAPRTKDIFFLALCISRNWPLCSVVFVSGALSGNGCVCDSLVCGVCVRFVSYCDPALQEAHQALLFSLSRAIDRSHVLLDPVTHWPCLAPALSFLCLLQSPPI